MGRDREKDQSPLRVVLMSGVGSSILIPLIEAGLNVVGVVEFGEPFREQSRLLRAIRRVYRAVVRSGPEPSEFIRGRSLSILETNDVDDPRLRNWLVSRVCDVLVVYNVPILPREFYSLARWAINLHPSMLPKYRGARPLFWAIWDGEEVAGCSVHLLEDRADAGPVLTQAEFSIPDGVRKRELLRYAEEKVGVPLILKALDLLARDEAVPVVQPSASPTRYAKWMERADIYAALPFTDWPVERVWRVLRFLELTPRRLDESRGSGAVVTWRVGGIKRIAGAGAPGSLQRDRYGHYISHSEGRIRLYRVISLKRILTSMLSIGRPRES